jgi:hypothetical protein
LASFQSEKKNFLSKNLFTQSSDSDSFRDSNDSSSLAAGVAAGGASNPTTDYGFQTPVRSKPHSSTSGGRGRGDDEDDDTTTTAAATAAAEAEALRSHQLLQMERKQLEIERKQFEFEKKMFETEKVQFENEKKLFQRQKERLEQERMSQSEGTPVKDMPPSSSATTMSGGSSDGGSIAPPGGAGSAMAAELAEVEEKYQKVLKDCEGLRRENISLQLEIEKGKKTLDTEKNVTPSLSSPSTH